MDFFGIGPWEILLILIVALIIVGPAKIPGIARTMGRTVRAIRRAGAEMTAAVTRELETAEKADKEKAAATGAAEEKPPAPARPPRASDKRPAEKEGPSIQ